MTPQHLTAPPVVKAQVWPGVSDSLPAEMALTPEVSPLTWTGVDELTVVPFPSSPNTLFPQHFTAPKAASAHVWNLPALMAPTYV